MSLKDANEDHTYAFKTSDLATVQGKLSRLNAVFTALQTASCEQLYTNFNRQAIPPSGFDKACLAYKDFVAQNGQGTFELRGFKFDTLTLHGHVLHTLTLGGTAQHSQQRRHYNFTFDTSRDTADVLGLRY